MTLLILASIVCFLRLATAAPPPWSGSNSWSGAPRNGPNSYQKTQTGINVQLGPRPYYLVDNMDAGPLKDRLESCKEGPFSTSRASISHRGAPLMFPEHSREGYHAAARMGASIIECDVSFTSDRQLVCRHSNCDLQYTTDILSRPELAKKCTAPFVPYNATTGKAASATCCTSDITLNEFKSLCAEMEGTTFNAMSINASNPYFGRIALTPDWRTNMYAYSCAEPMSLEDQIDVVEGYGLNFTAEAKTPQVALPFEGNYTQQDFAQQIVDTFRRRNISADRVWLQSFLPDDIFYWLQTSPDFGKQAIYLDERGDNGTDAYDAAVASLPGLADRGVKIISPPIWQLITGDNATGKIVPSSYAIAANEAGLEIITWSFDRSGPLEIGGGGYYYQSVANLINNDGDEYTVIDVMFQQVNVTKMFADWAAVVTYYANCFSIG